MFAGMFFAVLALAASNEAKSVEPTYQFKTKKADDIVVVKEDKRTVFVITSKRGIGGATGLLHGVYCPENVTFRFEDEKGKGVQMLENVTLTTDRIHCVGSQKATGKFNFHFIDAKRKKAGVEPTDKDGAGHLNVTVAANNG